MFLRECSAALSRLIGPESVAEQTFPKQCLGKAAAVMLWADGQIVVWNQTSDQISGLINELSLKRREQNDVNLLLLCL